MSILSVSTFATPSIASFLPTNDQFSLSFTCKEMSESMLFIKNEKLQKYTREYFKALHKEINKKITTFNKQLEGRRKTYIGFFAHLLNTSKGIVGKINWLLKKIWVHHFLSYLFPSLNVEFQKQQQILTEINRLRDQIKDHSLFNRTDLIQKINNIGGFDFGLRPKRQAYEKLLNRINDLRGEMFFYALFGGEKNYKKLPVLNIDWGTTENRKTIYEKTTLPDFQAPIIRGTLENECPFFIITFTYSKGALTKQRSCLFTNSGHSKKPSFQSLFASEISKINGENVFMTHRPNSKFQWGEQPSPLHIWHEGNRSFKGFHRLRKLLAGEEVELPTHRNQKSPSFKVRLIQNYS